MHYSPPVAPCPGASSIFAFKASDGNYQLSGPNGLPFPLLVTLACLSSTSHTLETCCDLWDACERINDEVNWTLTCLTSSQWLPQEDGTGMGLRRDRLGTWLRPVRPVTATCATCEMHAKKSVSVECIEVNWIVIGISFFHLWFGVETWVLLIAWNFVIGGDLWDSCEQS